MIKVQNLSYKYKNSNNILNNLNMEVYEGEILAIVGENGSGKSTLGKLLSGILKIKQGTITIDDEDIRKYNYNKNIGIVFQNPENQIVFSNIRDEMSFSLKYLSKEEIEERVITSLEKVKMYNITDKDLYELSLGQKQRVVIAEILAKKAKYIVFDEPTTMIDSKGKEKIYEIIKELKKDGYTIVYITNLSEELLLADRILILENGKIVEEIKKEELIEKSNILLEHNIKLPLIIELALKLNLKLEDFSIDEIAKKVGVKE